MVYPTEHNFIPLAIHECARSKKICLTWSLGPSYLFSNFPAATNANLTSLGTRWFGWSRSLRCNFLPPWRMKMRLSRAPENDFSVFRLTLQIHLVSLSDRICLLNDEEKTKFHAYDWPRKVISIFLSSRKSALVDVENTIFNLLFVVNHLDHQEHDLREVKKEMFHVVTWTYLFIFCLLNSKKRELGFVGKSIISVFPTTCDVIFWLFG
jgi:hypothetical protein